MLKLELSLCRHTGVQQAVAILPPRRRPWLCGGTSLPALLEKTTIASSLQGRQFISVCFNMIEQDSLCYINSASSELTANSDDIIPRGKWKTRTQADADSDSDTDSDTDSDADADTDTESAKLCSWQRDDPFRRFETCQQQRGPFLSYYSIRVDLVSNCM